MRNTRIWNILIKVITFSKQMMKIVRIKFEVKDLKTVIRTSKKLRLRIESMSLSNTHVFRQ